MVLDVVLEVACAIPMQSLCSFQVFKRILPFASHSSMELWNLRYETHRDTYTTSAGKDVQLFIGHFLKSNDIQHTLW